MKVCKLIFLLVALLTVSTADAKLKMTKDVYVFGFSASFTDSTVYFTDIQKLDSALIEDKGDLLMHRDEYARQLKYYFNDKRQEPYRTCVVYFGLTEKKAVKKLEKLKRLYTVKAKKVYNVVYLRPEDFKFTIVESNE